MVKVAWPDADRQGYILTGQQKHAQAQQSVFQAAFSDGEDAPSLHDQAASPASSPAAAAALLQPSAAPSEPVHCAAGHQSSAGSPIKEPAAGDSSSPTHVSGQTMICFSRSLLAYCGCSRGTGIRQMCVASCRPSSMRFRTCMWIRPHEPENQPGHGHTMRFGSTAKVLPKCMLKYYRISECGHGTPPHPHPSL